MIDPTSLNLDEALELIKCNREQASHQCHAISLALVKHPEFPLARVARGTCHNPDASIGSQHSWIVLGTDPYDPKATVIDPTLFSYSETIDDLWIGNAEEGGYQPFGWHEGLNIFDWGRPGTPQGPILEISNDYEPSLDGYRFLDMLGPLDWEGWSLMLGNAPVTGWPSGEILSLIHI